MERKEPILVYNRRTGALEPEIVMGETAVRLMYQNPAGRFLERILFKHRVFSKLYGFFQNRFFSRWKIEKAAAQLHIDLEEAEKPPSAYKTFNEFFTRRLKSDARPVDRDPACVISPCDARLFVVPKLSLDALFHIKGSTVNIEALLSDRKRAEHYSEGTLFLYRLCPSDYHRFHFPETCIPDAFSRIKGPLHSVNPIALSTGWRILDANERHTTLLHAQEPGGTICMIEIGAMCVGSVVQTYRTGMEVKRGDEKGLFRFGGSSVVVLYEKGRVEVDGDIAEQSERGIETLVTFGRQVGRYRRAGRA